MQFHSFVHVLREVFRKKRFLFLGLAVAFVFYVMNIFIASYRSLFDFYSTLGILGTFKFFAAFALGYQTTVAWYSFVTLLMISVLLGMLSSLIFYKTRLNMQFTNAKVGVFGTLGAFLGALIPGCAACGLGVASLLGLGGVLAHFLPYHGLEITFLSILFLGFGIYYTTAHMYTCRVALKRETDTARGRERREARERDKFK